MIRVILLLALALAPFSAFAQSVCSDSLQRVMQQEERTFLRSLPSGQQRRQAVAVLQAVGGDSRALDSIRHGRNVPPTLPGGVSARFPRKDIRLFSPTGSEVERLPLLLYLHGGGWCFGSVNSCARFCAAVAQAAHCRVAALNYPLAPEHPYPAAPNSCRDALRFLRASADSLGIDTARVFAGGDSAGGNLALALALSPGAGLRGVIPIYPVLRLDRDECPEWRKYAKDYGNDEELLLAFYKAYLCHGGDASQPDVSPFFADDAALRSLPPTMLISAGHDVLCRQARQFVERQRAQGHPTEMHLFPTVTHLFVTVPGQPSAFSEAVRLTAGFMRRQ